MNLDEVIEGWRSQDASTFYGVLDKTRLHQMLQQEHAELEKQSRKETRGGYIFGIAPLLLASVGVLLAIMVFPNDDEVLVAWDYVVVVAGVAAAIICAWGLFALRRSQQAREQDFGDSLRDHLRRRIKQIDDGATSERRIVLITFAAALICCIAIPVGFDRVVGLPYSEMDWPSPVLAVLLLGLLCLELFSWGPRRERRKNLPRKRQLEALLKEIDGQ